MSSEIEELRARVIASMASSGNPKSRYKGNLENVREGGELSSSSEEKENNQIFSDRHLHLPRCRSSLSRLDFRRLTRPTYLLGLSSAHLRPLHLEGYIFP